MQGADVNELAGRADAFIQGGRWIVQYPDAFLKRSVGTQEEKSSRKASESPRKTYAWRRFTEK